MAVRNDNYGGSDWIDGEELYAADLNDTFDAVTVRNFVLVPTAQLAYQMNVNGSLANADYLIADNFTAAAGDNSTVNTGTSTAEYIADDDIYVIGWNGTDDAASDTTSNGDGGLETFTNPDNAFDEDDATYAVSNYTSGTDNAALGKTFSAKIVPWINYKIGVRNTSGTGRTLSVKIQTYNGSAWSDIETVFSGDSSTSEQVVSGELYLNTSVQGIRFLFDPNTLNTDWDHRLYTLEYGDFSSSDTIEIDANTLTLDGTEKGIAVYVKDDIPTDTTLTVDISDGTTTLSAQAINSPIDISSLSSGTLELTFNLATTDTTKTPSVYGYGVAITK